MVGNSQRRRIKSMLTTVDNGIERALLDYVFRCGRVNSFDVNGPLCELFFKSESAIGDTFTQQQLIALRSTRTKETLKKGLARTCSTPND